MYIRNTVGYVVVAKRTVWFVFLVYFFVVLLVIKIGHNAE
jgi:hypothetical protein